MDTEPRENRPRLRNDLQIHPADTPTGRVFVIQDPVGLMEAPMMVGGPAVALLSLLDGEHDVGSIQAELTLRVGIPVPEDEIRQMLDRLAECLLLDTPRYQEAKAQAVGAFTAADILSPSLAGQAYPDERQALSSWADGLLEAYDPPDDPYSKIQAIVAPHIDFRVGGDVYAAAYGPLRGRAFDRLVILGVGHGLQEGLVALTEKDLETPLGTLPNDRTLVAELREAAGSAAAPDDFAFRGEHSVEFQAVLLSHVLGRVDVPVVPVLCGSFSHLLERHERAGDIPGIEGFLAILKERLRVQKERTLVVAGVDFSHVGPKFGHPVPSAQITPQSEHHDRSLLEAVCALDPQTFWDRERKAGGRFNVCGFSAMACLLEILPPVTTGRLAAYEIWHEGPTQSAVSFAAAVFTNEPSAEGLL